ncbi:MAG: L,D-transpeptidase [Candidatus Peregrinibacteria bacterium]|nr:L,D-transpeptidase [Candidatus Peregrinibacteria bacterium]
MTHRKKKRIRIFHPRKLWISLATLALTSGMIFGQAQLSQDQAMTGKKMTREVQVSAFNLFGSAKQGAQHDDYETSTLTAMDANPLEIHEADPKSGIKSVCLLESELAEGEEATYSAAVHEVKISEAIQPNESFRVEIYIENTGNIPWFGVKSGCEDESYVNLGTYKETDRATVFYNPGENTGWLGDNRIQMLSEAVQPGEIGTFAFIGLAPEIETEGNLYVEYFNLVVEGEIWFDDFDFAVDIPVGDVNTQDKYKAQFVKEMSIDTRSLGDLEQIEVNLSNQEMMLNFIDEATGESTMIYKLPISSGAAGTPTPTGTYTIFQQQELRVGGAAPHYRMPYWRMFTTMGHGLHALPYLGDPGGYFWEEALTHIGIPVSHGCIRMLPDDAALVYLFGYDRVENGEGLEIYIHY